MIFPTISDQITIEREKRAILSRYEKIRVRHVWGKLTNHIIMV